MLPYLAQGGALALEDALVLADCIAGHPCEASAFRRFEALRRRRAARVQRASARQGRIYHLPRPLAALRDRLIAALPGAGLMAQLDWLYGWRAPQ
jgi:salicylate hydroxylase